MIDARQARNGTSSPMKIAALRQTVLAAALTAASVTAFAGGTNTPDPPSGNLLLLDSLGRVVVVPTNEVPLGLQPPADIGVGHQIPDPAAGSSHAAGNYATDTRGRARVPVFPRHAASAHALSGEPGRIRQHGHPPRRALFFHPAGRAGARRKIPALGIRFPLLAATDDHVRQHDRREERATAIWNITPSISNRSGPSSMRPMPAPPAGSAPRSKPRTASTPPAKRSPPNPISAP